MQPIQFSIDGQCVKLGRAADDEKGEIAWFPVRASEIDAVSNVFSQAKTLLEQINASNVPQA